MPQKAYKQIVRVSFKLKKPPQMHSYYSQFLLICNFMITQFCGSNIFFKCVINIENMPKWCLPQDLKAIVYVILLAFGFFCFKLCFMSTVSPPKLAEQHGCDLSCRELTCLTACLWHVWSSYPSGTVLCPSGESPPIPQHSNSTEQRHSPSEPTKPLHPDS